jgi:hypothetical protein
MHSRSLILLGALGATAIVGYFVWSGLKSDPFAERREELARGRKEMKNRFDQPAEATAYRVNRRTGGWVRTGGRGSSPTGIGTPLDPSLYLAAIQQSRGMTRYSTATRTILPAGSDPLYNVNAPAGGTLGTWAPLGPTNQGGRTRQLLIQPDNPNIMYAAAVGGGVWKTTDGGANWAAMTDLAIPNIAVTSLAFDPTNYNRIYAGTGEGFFNFDAIRGAGIFVSNDAGNSWNQLASTNGQNFWYVNDLVVSPRNPQRIFAATRAGVFRSNDSGATWSLLATGPNGCSDLAMQMKRSIAYVYATCGLFTQGGDVKRALDSSTSTFSSVFTTTNMSRATLAIAPSNESIIYVLASNGASGAYNEAVRGVFRSTANGAAGTWTTQMANNGSTVDPVPLNNLLLTNPVYAYTACVGSSARGLFNQGWYDQTIAVDPVDPQRVWVGGIDLFRSDDGGQNFGVASYWWKDKGNLNYSHADQHVIAFHPGYNGTSNRIMFNANDGGIFRTNDARAAVSTTVAQVCATPASGAVTWTELNNNYTTTQFYQGTPYANGDTFFGGMQDNGTWRGTTASSAWTNLLGGDGGYTAVDNKPSPADNVLFAAFTGLSFQKSTNNGATFSDAITGIGGDGGFAFISPFHMNPGNRQHLWTGGWILWRTINQAASWTRASFTTPGNGSVSAIASSESDTNKVVFGMDDGWIGFNTAALSTDNTTNWSSTQPRADVSVTSLAYDPSNSNNVWATYGTFSGNSVYRSTNSGATWTAVPGTGVNTLPAVPALTVVVHPTDSNRVYVGTDIGVFTTIDGGLNWYKEVTGFANVSVEWLAINTTGTRRLYAFTHGRGAWRVNLIP